MLMETTGRRRRSGKGRGRSRSKYRVESRIKRSGSRNYYQVGAIVLLISVVVGCLGAAYAGICFARDSIFVRNDRFNIRKIEIVDGQIKTEEMIREYLAYEGINIGTNLFGFDVKEFESVYLERNPLIRTIQITRVFPDTLKVAIRERDPLVRLGQRGSLVADSEGFVFRLSSNLHRLPVIIGCKDPKLEPGKYVNGRACAAVELLAVCDNPRIGLRTVGVDVSPTDYLLMHILTPDGIKKAQIAWDDMGNGTADSRKSLLLQLSRLKQVIQTDRGRHDLYDATLPGRVYVR